MKFRKTTIQDINNVMQIINEAKEYFRKSKIHQWQMDIQTVILYMLILKIIIVMY